jgi:TonB-dependent receptor
MVSRTFRVLATALAIAAATMGTPQNAAAQTGTVTGVVVDRATGLTLAGVAVRVESLDRAVYSNSAGRFNLLALPPGRHTLTTDYLGYASDATTVDVSAGEVVSVEIEMRTAALELEGVTIVGQRRGQAAALSQQLNASTITNVVAADQIGRFPDANIGDAMKRIPGIVVMQDQGEARFGLIRGTEPRLNSITINGERIPSAEPEIREVQLDLIPSDMVSAVEVTKALTPDMDADAIGASVNIVTRSAPASRRLSATLGSGFNFLAEKPMGIFSGVYAQRFADDRLGMVVSGSYFNHQLGSDNIEGEWSEGSAGPYVEEFQIREYQVQRIRRSVSGSLDWRVGDGSTLTWRSMYNHRDDWENRFRLVYGMDEPDASGATVAELERESKGGIGSDRVKNQRLEDQRTSSHSLSGTHLFGGGMSVEWQGQWAQASQYRPNERYINFVAEDVPVQADISDPGRPRFTIQGAAANDLSQFELDELTEENSWTRDRDLNGRLDVTMPFASGRTELQLGGRYRDKSKLQDNDFTEFDSALGTLADAPRENLTNPDFIPGDYAVGEFASRGYLGGLDLTDGELVLDEFIPANFEADERIVGGYAMLTQRLGDRTRLIAGARVEQTRVDYIGNEFVDDDESFRPTEGDQSYTNVFPSLTLRHELGDGQIVRAAWTNTIARPNYYDLVPYRLVNREDGELEVGNPVLEPTRSMNFDLMYERFFSSVGILSAGAFYKNIDDFIFGYTVQNATDPVTGQVFSEITQPQNGAGAELLGFELAVQRNLPAGFGIYLNYTFTESSVEGLPIPGRENEDLPLPGSSKHTGNASLSFDDERFSFRASLNFQDDFIDPGELGGSAFYDRWYDRATTVDLNGTVRLTGSARFFFEANNLTNQPLRYYQGERSRLMQEEFYDLRIQTGIKIDLN